MTIKHAQISVNVDDVIRDGDFDAVLVSKVTAQAYTDFVVWHRLGRVPRQISIVWKDRHCDWKVAKDAMGAPMQDKEKIVLNFTESGTTMTLRIA